MVTETVSFSPVRIGMISCVPASIVVLSRLFLSVLVVGFLHHRRHPQTGGGGQFQKTLSARTPVQIDWLDSTRLEF
jgi:hypothetical protein